MSECFTIHGESYALMNCYSCGVRYLLMRVARAAALVPGKSYAEPDSWDDPPLIGKAVVYIDRDLVKAIAAEVAALPAALLAEIKEMKDV